MPPAITSTPTAPGTRGGGWLWLALFFLIGVLLPAWLIDQLIDQFEAEQHRILELGDKTRARTLMGRLDRHLDRASLISEGLETFRRRLLRKLAGRPLTSERVGLLTRDFFRTFPASTRVYWFDHDGKVIQPAGLPPVPERTAWQALFRSLTDPDRLTSMEDRLAQNMVRATMGEMVDLPYLREALHRPTPLLFKGEESMMAGFRFAVGSQGKGRRAGLLVVLPVGRASFGWELKRAVKRLTTTDERVGGYWQSLQSGYGDGVAEAAGLLNPSLMHGLFQQLENGQGFCYHGGFTFLARFWSQDPDMVLVAAVRQTSGTSRVAERILVLVRWANRGGVVVVAGLLAAMGLGFLAPEVRLATRFRLGTAILTGFPLLVLTIWGLDFLMKSSQHHERETEQRLEGLLLSAEQAVASGIPQAEERLRKMERRREWADVQNPADLIARFRRFEAMGLLEQTIARNGKPILYSAQQTRIGGMSGDVAVKYLLGKVLEAAKFEIPDLEKISSPALDALIQGQDVLDLLPNGRLRVNQFGGEARFMYSLLSRTATGAPDTLLMLSFNFQRFCAYFFRAWVKRLPRGTGFFLRSSSLAGIRREPRHRRLRELLDLVENNPEPVTMSLTGRGRTYLARGRPLAGLGTVGVAVLPFDEFGGAYAHSLRLLALFGGMALLLALFLAELLEFLLLAPVLGLSRAMGELERGNYDVVARGVAPDELGTLAEGFNRLVEGLRQKSRMLPFLNRDLVAQAHAAPARRTERRQVAVTFSGLRAFCQLEERVSPEEAMSLRNEFLSRCEVSARAWGGSIDKFLGDAAMAVFSEVPGKAPPEERAVRAALALDSQMRSWTARREAEGRPAVRHGTGIAFGPVIAGHIGSLRKRLDATVIGDTVNLAARLEKEAGRPGQASILAAATVFHRPLARVRLVPTAITSVRGRAGAVTVFGVEAADV
ncbi:MAG: adenylate/guanylate cyclase domain-containing protein [Candidatus Riflebacteria bacterium]|nr:adenylate/guanylate cyclase domain-containing protein [Candidatus Riflebacteria bacterium]